MKKTLIIFLVLFTIGILSAEEKTIKIGDFNWYTEQNSFNDIVNIAQKVNKPILAVFSAKWCAPCKSVKKYVFENKEFSKIENQVVLLYIEETTKEGKIYNQHNNIRGWPSFKIFSKDGVLLDGVLPGSRNLKGFLSWIKKVKSGDNYFELLKKINKNPDDRKALIEIVDKIGHGGSKEKLKYLKRALKINSDFNDTLSHKAYERIMEIIIANIPYKESKEKIQYLISNKVLIDKIILAYYPDKFKYNIKSNFGTFRILTWYNQNKEYKKAVKVFDDYIKSKKNGFNFSKDMLVIKSAFKGLLQTNKIKRAEQLIEQIEEFSKNKELNKQPKYFLYSHYRCYMSFIDYYGKLKNIKKAESYAKKYFELIEKIGNKRFLKSSYNRLALEYGIFAERRIKDIIEENKTLNGEQLSRSIISISKIYEKIGDAKNSHKVMLELYNNKLLENIEPLERGRILNAIAWRLFEIKKIDRLTLQIAKESVQFNATTYNLDTLANILAKLKYLKEAIETENKAIKMATSEDLKKNYAENIKNWEKIKK